MDDDGFELPVSYKGEELQFPAKLVQFGYSFKIEVEVNGTSIAFERDEERNWRGLTDPETMQKNKKVSTELLQAIVLSLDRFTK